MARRITDKPNVNLPDSDFIYGRIRDKADTLAGTPVNELVYGDFHQFFARLLDKGNIIPNGLPDCDYTGWQLYDALIAIRDAGIMAEAILRAAADTAESTARASAISAEATSRSNADTTLQSNITAEATTRASADTTLQTNKADKAALIMLTASATNVSFADSFVQLISSGAGLGSKTTNKLMVSFSCVFNRGASTAGTVNIRFKINRGGTDILTYTDTASTLGSSHTVSFSKVIDYPNAGEFVFIYAETVADGTQTWTATIVELILTTLNAG